MAEGSRPTVELLGPLFPSAVLEQRVGAVRDLRGCLERGGELRN